MADPKVFCRDQRRSARSGCFPPLGKLIYRSGGPGRWRRAEIRGARPSQSDFRRSGAHGQGFPLVRMSTFRPGLIGPLSSSSRLRSMDQAPSLGRETAIEPVLRSRLLPRISFRSMLVFTAISAVFIAVAYAADQGGVYSAAAAVGLFFAACMLCLSASIFLLAWAVSFLPRLVGAALVASGLVFLVCRIVGAPLGGMGFLLDSIWLLNFQVVGWFLLLFPIGREPALDADSPFAESQFPPQIYAPREPTN